MRPLFNTLKLGYFEPLHSYYPFERHFLVGLMPFPSVLGKNCVQFKLLIDFLTFLLIFFNGLASKCGIFCENMRRISGNWKFIAVKLISYLFCVLKTHKNQIGKAGYKLIWIFPVKLRLQPIKTHYSIL